MGSVEHEDEGYSNKLVDGLPTRFTCSLCYKLLRKPLQTTRGEIACTSCYFRAKGDTNICPIDHEEIDANQVFPDRAKEREIQSLLCFCENQRFGCNWYGVVGTLQDHPTSQCQFSPLDCDLCHKKFSQIELENHRVECFKNVHECPFGPYGCNFQIKNNEVMVKKIAALEQNLKLVLVRVGMLEHEVTPGKNGKGGWESSSILKDMAKHVRNNSEELKRIEKSQNVLDVDLMQLVHKHENTTYTGHMVWKIDNYEHRYKQAVTGKTTALHSAPAFTEKYGYKFCARLYLNGDGMGKGTHLSLFFILMKSEFDNLLQWPFTKTVTFTLINQNNPVLNVKETFNPDVNSQSFKKPTNQMNISSGYPFFVTHEKLKKPGYIKNQCFFLDVKVE